MVLFQNGHTILLGVACIFWIVGGWLITIRCFNLPKHEQVLVGFAIGLTAGNWTANLLAHYIPLPYAFWLAALLVLLAGAALSWRMKWRDLLASAWASVPLWLVLGGIVYVMFIIGRGLAIFDDYQNLPTLSIMASGDISPHFSLDPSLRFGYHYFLILQAAQFMRLGALYPWNALDLARALTLGLTLVLVALWVRRIAQSRLAGWLAAILVAFTGGVRWLVLLFPPTFVQKISGQIQLMGSGLASGPNLVTAMVSPWIIEGSGPIPFPFAFANGVNSPFIMAFSGFGMFYVLILVVLLMTYDRWQHWTAGVVTTILLASLALANEVTLVLLLAGAAITLVTYLVIKRAFRLPKNIIPWVVMTIVALLIAVFQGGMLTELVRNRFLAGTAQKSYYDVSFSFVWPLTVVSSHLGLLKFNNPYQILMALLELGPVILVFPFVVKLGVQKLRDERWFEAALIGASVVSLFSFFVQYTGTGGISGTTRLPDALLFTCKLYAVPLVWNWAKGRGEVLRTALVATGLVTIFGGMVLFGIELIAAAKPVSTTFLRDMDVKMEAVYWNRLEPGALIFDPIPWRAPTVFGRFTKAYDSWNDIKPEWKTLIAAPDPYRLRAAGFDYIYYDGRYLKNLPPQYQTLLQIPCVKLVQQYDGYISETDYGKDFRRLVDIRACK